MSGSIDLKSLKKCAHFTADEIVDNGPISSNGDEYPPGHPGRYLHSIKYHDEQLFAIKLFDQYYEVDPGQISRYWIGTNEHTLENQAWIKHIYIKKAGLYLHPVYNICFEHPQKITDPNARAYIATSNDFDADKYLETQQKYLEEYNDPEQYTEKYKPHAVVENSMAYLHVQRFFPSHEPSEANHATARKEKNLGV